MFTVTFEKRDGKAKPAGLRRKGRIPAVFYGRKENSTAISVPETEFKKIWREAGESSIVVLKNGGEEHETLIHDVDLHPVSGALLHADFYVIEKGKKLKVDVPLSFVGVAPAVKDLSGTLVKVLHALEIEALPKDLPHDIQLDIAALATLESRILAKDIPLPAGVTLITHADEVAAAIAVAKEEPVEEITKSIEDIEVVGGKGKETPEGEEAGDSKEPKKETKAEDTQNQKAKK